MATTRITVRLLSTLTLWSGFGLTASAQLPAMTADKALEVKPRQPGVAVGTPAAAGCRVDPIPNPKTPGTNMGYVVRDAAGKPVRQFVSYDNKSFNIVSFFADGVECYREIDSNLDGTPDQYRWLGANGGKWGVDRDQDGKVDSWAVISAEEVTQELLEAVKANDAKRLQALVATPEELAALGHAIEADRMKAKAAGVGSKLAAAAAELKLPAEAKWSHVELAAPHTVPADAFGGKEDLVTHKNGTVFVENGMDPKFVQTGEMVQVGRAWKLVEGPSAGHAGTGPMTGAAGNLTVSADAKQHIEQLNELDKTAPASPTPQQLSEFNGKRAALLEQVVAKTPPEHQEPWLRQLVDSLAAAAEGGQPDGPAHARLKQVRDAMAKANPPLGAYCAFRVLVAENGMALNQPKPDVKAVQDKWRDGLEAFLKDYPAAEDAPEAALRLAMGYEFAGGKDGEAKARTWYEYITAKHPQHAHATKAAGCIKRLTCEGQPFALQGPKMDGQAFSTAQLAGKTVVVYYWASWSSNLPEDVKKLKELMTTYGPKGAELVSVNLDADPKAAAQAAAGAGLPGTHLYQPGGLDGSPLAAAYGVMVVPQVFVVGKDGKVVNRNAQVGVLEEDLKKLAQ